MRYQVVWTRRADSELADVWTDSADRNAVSYAARQIDSALARDPLACGESRTAGRRIFFVQPLVVIFRVVEADRTVRVLGVRRYGKT
jgi:plasmid stabilization system protein ParE